MAKNKTVPSAKSVDTFIASIDDEQKRDDSYELIKILKGITADEPLLWGPSIIGFGSYHYKYETGREGDMPLAAFSPRKSAIVLYILGFDKKEAMLEKLGKHKPSKGCVYIKRLSDINVEVLKKIIVASIKSTKKKYPS
jgi:hypothetical protein